MTSFFAVSERFAAFLRWDNGNCGLGLLSIRVRTVPVSQYS